MTQIGKPIKVWEMPAPQTVPAPVKEPTPVREPEKVPVKRSR